MSKNQPIDNNENNQPIDNNENNPDNTGNLDGNNEAVQTGADLSGSEDTHAWESIIAAKDGIIGTYEKQVEALNGQIDSLNAQIAKLVRGGAAIQDESAANPEPTKLYTGGFGKGIDAYGDGFGVAELGKEIGTR